jgi:hypothetical protein
MRHGTTGLRLKPVDSGSGSAVFGDTKGTVALDATANFGRIAHGFLPLGAGAGVGAGAGTTTGRFGGMTGGGDWLLIT